MRTLRESIDQLVSSSQLYDIYVSVYNNYYSNKDITMMDVERRYSKVIDELMDLPKHNDMSHHLLLTQEKEHAAHVGYLDVDTGEIHALDFIDWVELIDLMIEDRSGWNMADQVSHVLWELTFWGWNRDTIRKGASDLMNSCAESEVEMIELSTLMDQLSGQ